MNSNSRKACAKAWRVAISVVYDRIGLALAAGEQP